MRHLIAPLFLFCLIALSALAVQSIDQPFAELKLAGGRVLQNARLKSFNTTSVFVRSDSGVAQVRYEDFPDELQPQLTKARNEARAAASTPPPDASAERRAAAEHEAFVRREEAAETRWAASQQGAPAPGRESPTAISKVETAVTRRLQSYYLTQPATGIPSSARPASVTVDIDLSEPVPGWDGRYRTTGRATILTAGRYERNYACTFDVLSEIDDRNVIRIIDIRSDAETTR